MSFISFWKELKNLPNLYLFYIYLCTARASFKLSLYFFRLQAALVTNALIPTSIFVSYYCRVPTARKVRLRFHLIVVGAPKLQLKDDNADFQVFLSEKWKLSNNRQTSDYALTIGRLPIIEKLPINRPNRLIGLSLIFSDSKCYFEASYWLAYM